MLINRYPILKGYLKKLIMIKKINENEDKTPSTTCSVKKDYEIKIKEIEDEKADFDKKLRNANTKTTT